MRRQLAVVFLRVLHFNVAQAFSAHVMHRLQHLSDQVAQMGPERLAEAGVVERAAIAAADEAAPVIRAFPKAADLELVSLVNSWHHFVSGGWQVHCTRAWV